MPLTLLAIFFCLCALFLALCLPARQFHGTSGNIFPSSVHFFLPIALPPASLAAQPAIFSLSFAFFLACTRHESTSLCFRTLTFKSFLLMFDSAIRREQNFHSSRQAEVCLATFRRDSSPADVLTAGFFLSGIYFQVFLPFVCLFSCFQVSFQLERQTNSKFLAFCMLFVLHSSQFQACLAYKFKNFRRLSAFGFAHKPKLVKWA